MNRKIIPFLLGAAVVAPLYLSTPAEAQSLRDIQRLEQRVNQAKARGNWGAAQNLEVQLNMARLQYQRNNGMGEVNDRGYYNYNVRTNPSYRNTNNWQWRQNQRGYYDQYGRWHRY